MPENRTVWKSDNQGVKEETLIQTGRRGGHGQPGQRECVARRLTKQARHSWTGWSHIQVQISQEEQLRSETDHTTQGSSP